MFRVKRRFLPARFRLQARADALTFKRPGYPEPVGADLMQITRSSFAIEVDFVAVREHTQLPEIEVCIQTLQRIEGPRNPLDALSENSLALRLLKPVAQVEVTIRSLDRKHVRMMHDVAIFITGK